MNEIFQKFFSEKLNEILNFVIYKWQNNRENGKTFDGWIFEFVKINICFKFWHAWKNMMDTNSMMIFWTSILKNQWREKYSIERESFNRRRWLLERDVSSATMYLIERRENHRDNAERNKSRKKNPREREKFWTFNFCSYLLK